MSKPRPWWHALLSATRTRILLVYMTVMFLVGAVSVPIFLILLFKSVETRVQEDMTQEIREFKNAYARWQKTASDGQPEFRKFLVDYVTQQLPEDDIFLIVVLDEQLLASNPTALPAPLKPGSALAQRWMAPGHQVSGKAVDVHTSLGDILYVAQPLILRNRVRGAFVVVHGTAGERQEALDVVGIFAQVAIGVVIIASIVTWFATARILAPVRQLVSAARTVNESDLSQRIPPIQGSGEMAELAETFNNMMSRLQDAFTSQRNFINDAGHELRTPITIIQGHLELLGIDPQGQQETIDLVMDELGRMNRMINDLILLTKAERPDFLSLESIDMQVFIEELFAKSRTLADRQWRLQSQGNVYLIGDRQRLTGAMLNLIENATHYTQPDDTIEIGWTMRQQKVRLWVRDTGEGIAPADQKRIFERFARAANHQRRSEGSGLGLAIVRAMAEAHGGRVELTSQVGRGSTFTLVLPLKPAKGRLTS